MPDPAHIKRVTRALDALREVPDPLARLDAVRVAVERLQQLETTAVADARQGGATWGEIGLLYGLTKQGAQQRFRLASKRSGRTPRTDAATLT